MKQQRLVPIDLMKSTLFLFVILILLITSVNLITVAAESSYSNSTSDSTKWLSANSTNAQSLDQTHNVFLPIVIKPAPPWVVTFADNFEGTFPGSWEVMSSRYNWDDGNWYDITSEISWGKRNCRVFSGAYSAWMSGGGSIGSTALCSDGYPDDYEAWLVYGPVDLSHVYDAYASLQFWADIEYDYDFMGWGISIDNDMFYGSEYSGTSNGWVEDTIDLKNVYTLGNVIGKSQVWIGIWFSSDVLNYEFYEGAAIDDFYLSSCSSSTGCIGNPILSSDRLLVENKLKSKVVERQKPWGED
jgi:hypothetical protein